RGDEDVAARGSPIRGGSFRALAACGTAGHPDARAADLSQLGPALLRLCPGAILKDIDGDAARNSEMKIKFAVEIFEMTVTVDETGQNGLSWDVDYFGIGRNRNVSLTADGREPAAANEDAGIVDRRGAGAVDQRTPLHHQGSILHVVSSSSQTA